MKLLPWCMTDDDDDCVSERAPGTFFCAKHLAAGIETLRRELSEPPETAPDVDTIAEEQNGDALVFHHGESLLGSPIFSVISPTTTLSPGKGCMADGDIVFSLASGAQVLVFKGDGRVLVRGEQVNSNLEIYWSFRRWMELSKITSEKQ